MPNPKDHIVYSTDPDFKRPCPHCGRYPCACRRAHEVPASQQTARIACERKGRAGKVVTVISGLQLSAPAQVDLLKSLKQTCGTGGTIKANTLEIQGDHRQRLATRLQDLGYRVKLVGG